MDHVALAESLGCKAVRVRSPGEVDAAFAEAEALMEEHQVSVVMGKRISCLDPSLTLENG